MRTGLDRLLASDDPASYGRTGWLVNGSSVAGGDYRWAPSVAAVRGFHVTQLFAPEHGVHGAVAEGVELTDHDDPWTGLPTCSLYPSNAERLAAALDRCDTVVIDLMDNGTRYSTNLATAADIIDAVAAHPRPPRVVVADRPNLLGRRREGPPLTPGFETIVGRLHVPARHGLTFGEAMRQYLVESELDIELEVVTVEGWDPTVMLEHGPYLPPSPNLPSFTAQLLYTGSCLFEGTNISEGRGTATPFQLIGAPWLDAPALADQLRADDWPGVLVRPVAFVPSASKHRGELCSGVFLHVTDSLAIQPIELSVRLLELVFAQSERTELRVGTELRPGWPDRFLDRLWGNDDLARHLLERSGEPFAVPHGDAGHSDLDAVALYPTGATGA
jgi:uncharacterized protein YbbC (DUF1343 family)